MLLRKLTTLSVTTEWAVECEFDTVHPQEAAMLARFVTGRL
jgi:hypothetical protein